MKQLQLTPFEARQIKKMRLCIDDFKINDTSISGLYSNLEFLWYQLAETRNELEKTLPLDCIFQLEMLYASFLDGAVSASDADIEAAQLVRIIESYLDQFDTDVEES